MIDTGGVLYGTTYAGGLTGAYGSVFSLSPPVSSGGSWTVAVLHDFTGRDGGSSSGSVAIGSGGVLYGTTTIGGGKANHGAVFSLRPSASTGGAWTETVLHSFTGDDGGAPKAGVVIDPHGLLYGTTSTNGSSGNGTVFSLKP